MQSVHQPINNSSVCYLLSLALARSLPSVAYCVGVRGQSYGIHTVRVDGGDPRAIYLATREARKMALEQNCPILIEVIQQLIEVFAQAID